MPRTAPWIDQAARDQPLKVGLLGSDVLVLNRSDYGPFRTRHVPFLFFSTGENPRYHSPDDTPETLDYPKLTAISRVIHRVAATAADAARGSPLVRCNRSSPCRGDHAPRRDRQAAREPEGARAGRRLDVPHEEHPENARRYHRAGGDHAGRAGQRDPGGPARPA